MPVIVPYVLPNRAGHVGIADPRRERARRGARELLRRESRAPVRRGAESDLGARVARLGARRRGVMRPPRIPPPDLTETRHTAPCAAIDSPMGSRRSGGVPFA